MLECYETNHPDFLTPTQNLFYISHLKSHYSVYESVPACCLDPLSNFTFLASQHVDLK